jgi:hypothetical protein
MREGRGLNNLPVNITTIFASSSELRVQLNADKDAPFPLNRTNKSNCPGHTTSNIDDISKRVVGSNATAGGGGNHIL